MKRKYEENNFKEGEEKQEDRNNLNINELPLEIFFIILNELQYPDFLRCCLVCKGWNHHILNSPRYKEVKKERIVNLLSSDPIINKISDIEFGVIKHDNRMFQPIRGGINYEGKILLSSTDGNVALTFKDSTHQIVELGLLRDYLSPSTIQKINKIVPDLIPEKSLRPIKGPIVHV